MNKNARSTVNVLIAGIDAFLKNPNLNTITLRRSENGQGIESCNLFVTDNRYVTEPQGVTFQEFKQGAETIYDKDPDWKQHYTDVIEDL